MDTNTLLTLLTILGGGTGIGSIIVAMSTRKKSKVEATSEIEKASAHLVGVYREDNAELRRECVELKRRVDELEGKVDEQDVCQTSLQAQIRALEAEKQTLIERIEELQKRISSLEDENRRLKGEV